MAEKWKEWRELLETVLHDRDRIGTKLLERIEARIGIDRVNIVFIVKIFVVIYLVVGHGREFVCNLIGFLYPAYKSIKAIESKEKDDDTKWLTYWVVYAAFSLLEFFSDYFLSWIPFYWLLKCLFLIVCMVPFRWNGSTIIYKRIIRPFFLKHQQTIDSAVDVATEAGESLVEEATGKNRKRISQGRGDKDGNGKDTTAGRAGEETVPSASKEEEGVQRKRILKRKDRDDELEEEEE